MQFILITGLSGAGKALAMRNFEDFGFFCVDNLPPQLIPMFAELCMRGDIGKAAIVADVRGGTFFNELNEALDQLRAQGVQPLVLFLDAENDLLIQRFKETRRRHPLSDQFSDLSQAIAAEREALLSLREHAYKIVNTSHVTPRELREEIRKTFLEEPDASQMRIRVESFGFKHGLPLDADMVFDIRFLPNPNYDREIGHLDGNCAPVIDYVMREEVTQKFLQHLHDFTSFCVPQFETEGKAYLTIAVGCTGGRHRSVALANWLCGDLHKQGFRVSVSHRDLDRSAREARNFEGPPAEKEAEQPNDALQSTLDGPSNSAASSAETKR